MKIYENKLSNFWYESTGEHCDIIRLSLALLGGSKMGKLVKCQVCGLIMEEDKLHDACPKCNAPKEKFDVLADDAAEKVFRSEYTNDLHMRLINYCNKIEALAEAGIDDNLDPACVKLFKKAKEEAILIKQISKAELAGHMNKGKW
jgi:rubredoxin